MRISDWSSDVCSSDLRRLGHHSAAVALYDQAILAVRRDGQSHRQDAVIDAARSQRRLRQQFAQLDVIVADDAVARQPDRVRPAAERRGGAVVANLPAHLELRVGTRSKERPVGKACVRTCRQRWSPSYYKKQNITKIL